MTHWEKVWEKEYIASLREKFYGASKPEQEHPPSLGDVVIIASEGNRAKWPLGRITKLLPDESGIVRVVEVYTRGNYQLKTVNKLVPLELPGIEVYDTVNPEESNTIEYETEPSTSASPTTSRPKRLTAQKADMHRKQLLQNDQL